MEYKIVNQIVGMPNNKTKKAKRNALVKKNGRSDENVSIRFIREMPIHYASEKVLAKDWLTPE